MNAIKIAFHADALQNAREQKAKWAEVEELHSNALKANGVGEYEGTIANVVVQNIERVRPDVDKIIRKLNISQHVYNRYYTITTPVVRATVVSKKIEHRKVA